jgi:hypothetical protein
MSQTDLAPGLLNRAAAMRCYYLCSDDGHKGCLQAVAIAMHKILAPYFFFFK